MKEALVEVSDLSLTVPSGKAGRRVLVQGLSVVIARGQILCLMGPNGCGKTTLLRVLLGELAADAGSCRAECGPGGKAYIPQQFRNALFPWLSVRRNGSLYGVGRTGLARQRLGRLFRDLRLRLSSRAVVGHLSGGEQQLLLLSLVLTREATLLVLDEPFAAVDLKRRALARRAVLEAVEARQAVGVMVTHDVEDAAEISDRTVIFEGDEGGGTKSLSCTDRQEYRRKLAEAFAS